MSERSLNIAGTVASIVGLLVTVLTVFFTEYKIMALISLFIFEIALVLIWFYYVKQKHRVVYPYEYEIQFQNAKYIFESPSKMEYELFAVIRITRPHLPNLIWKNTWSGRGNISIKSVYSNKIIPHKLDGTTGEISFYYPSSSAYKFGDIVVVAYKIICEDLANQNIPELNQYIRVPTELAVAEVVLTYKDENSPASFNFRPIETGSHSLVTFQKDSDIEFNKGLRSYRVVIPNPEMHHVYQIKWDS